MKQYICTNCNGLDSMVGLCVKCIDFECWRCNKKYENVYDFQYHMGEHLRDRNNYHRYTCEICGAVFQRNGTYITHCNSHVKNRTYLCNKCKYYTHKISYFAQHSASHYKRTAYNVRVLGPQSICPRGSY
jgi:hypothetical protein